MKDRIIKELSSNLTIRDLEVINESHLHSGHAGHDGSGESHFVVVLSCDELTNKSKVESHRVVNGILKKEFDNGLHALSIKLV